MGGQKLAQFFQQLQAYGFIDFLLPFFLITAILYGVLMQIKIFGEQKKEGGKAKTIPSKRINMLLAIGISGLIVFLHASNRLPPAADPVVLLYKLLGNAAMMLAALLIVVLLIGMTTEDAAEPKTMQLLIGLIAIAVVGFTFLVAIFPALFPDQWIIRALQDPGAQALLFIGAVGILVFMFLTSEKKDKELKDVMQEIMMDKWT